MLLYGAESHKVTSREREFKTHGLCPGSPVQTRRKSMKIDWRAIEGYEEREGAGIYIILHPFSFRRVNEQALTLIFRASCFEGISMVRFFSMNGDVCTHQVHMMYHVRIHTYTGSI